MISGGNRNPANTEDATGPTRRGQTRVISQLSPPTRASPNATVPAHPGAQRGSPPVTPSAVIEVFPAKGKLMFGWQGIGVQPFGRRVFYFWTRQPAEILTALAAAHFPVSWAERHVRYRGAG
jgi:hypothetical protein